MTAYEIVELTDEERERLRCAYLDLMELAASCAVPSVRSAARTAVALVHQAMNGQRLEYEQYTGTWE